MALPIILPPCEEAAAQIAPETPGCAAHARRWVLAATVLASSVVFLQATVINIALPAIQDALGAPVAIVQWIASAYTLVLAALTLVGGALGDRLGRRRLLIAGLALFGVATLVAGLAPSALWLIVGRGLQGLGAALVAPNSLAHLSASFPRAARGRALGIWSAASSLTGGASPLLGGWLVDAVSWRAAFLVGVPLTLGALALVVARVPENRAPHGAALDVPGAVLAALAFGALTAGLIAAAGRTPIATTWGLVLAGVVLLGSFVRFEWRTPTPMMPPGLFRSRAFSGATLLTVLLYFAVSAAFFLLPFALVRAYGYSATASGIVFLPFAIVVGVLSRWAGSALDRWGAKWPLVIGPAVVGLGLALFARLPDDGRSMVTILVAMSVVGLGMAATITPLTAVVMGAVEPDETGVASGINNTVARLAALLGVAVAGLLALSVFSAAVQRRIAALDLPPVVRQEILAGRRDLGDARVPASAGAAAPAVDAALRSALVDAFRAVALLSSMTALAAAVCAALWIDARAAAAAPGEAIAPFICEHLGQVVPAITPASAGCEECLRTNQHWVHLRLCLACGHVGCCDASANQHATRHFRTSGHAIVQSLAPGETWRWCYMDEHVV